MDATLSRRRFLQAVAASGLAATLARADDGPGRRRKFTMDLVPGAIGVKATQPEAIALAHEFGFESVAPDAAYLARLSEAEMRDLLADLKAKGLVWGAAGLPVNFRGDDAAFAADLDRLDALAAGLRRAGATRVGTWISPSHRELTYTANFRQHTLRLRRVADRLSEHGLRLGLEYVGPKTSWTANRYPFVHTMAQTKDLIAAIGRPNVGLVLDSWHWYTAGESEEDLLTLSNDEVVACDLNDAPANLPVDEQIDSRRELPCATGVIDLRTFLGALVTIGYDGPVRAEPFKADLRELPREQAVAMTARAMKKAFAVIE